MHARLAHFPFRASCVTRSYRLPLTRVLQYRSVQVGQETASIMGFHIPDAAPALHQRDLHDAPQASSSMSTQTAEAPSFAPNFSAVAARRRRNALVPVLTLDVVGSPRSPYVCLTHNHRLELMQQFDRQQREQQTSSHVHIETHTETSSIRPSAGKQTRRSHPAHAPSSSSSFFAQP